MTTTPTEQSEGGAPTAAPTTVPAEVWKSARDATDFLDGARRELAEAERRITDRLGLSAGMSVLDVGCGTGTDIEELAAELGPGTRAVGVDSSAELVAQAGGRPGARAEFEVGDAARLPFRGDDFDAVYAKRVVEHVPDQVAAVREMLRVTVPGGRIVVADPDHGMWSPDMDDVALTRDVMAWWCDHIPHPWTGRRLPGVVGAAGAEDVQVEAVPLVLRSLAAADALTWIGKAAGVAERKGAFDTAAIRAWDEELRARDAEGRFLMLGVLTVVSGRKPAFA